MEKEKEIAKETEKIMTSKVSRRKTRKIECIGKRIKKMYQGGGSARPLHVADESPMMRTEVHPLIGKPNGSHR